MIIIFDGYLIFSPKYLMIIWSSHLCVIVPVFAFKQNWMVWLTVNQKQQKHAVFTVLQVKDS